MVALHKKEAQIIQSMVIQIMLIILCAVFLTKLMLASSLQNYLFQFHLSFELICIFISLAIFLLIWYTYENNYQFNGLILISSLAMGIFEILQLCLYAEVILPSNDLAGWYSILSKFTFVLSLLLISKNRQITGNKYILLFFTLLSVALISTFVYMNIEVLPVLYSGEQATLFKKVIKGILILLSLVSLYYFRTKYDPKDFIACPQIITALIFFLLNQLCLLINISIFFNDILAHFFKIIYFFFLFKGFFVCAVQYPYRKFDEDKQSVLEIFDELPLGFMMYDKNMRLFFANKKALEYWSAFDDNKISNIHHDEIVKKLGLIDAFDMLAEDRRIIKDIDVDLQVQKGIVHKFKVEYCRFPNSYLVLFEDVKIEKECELLKLQTKTVLDAINKVILLLDEENKVVLCNKSTRALLELKEEEVIGRNITDLLELLQLKANGVEQHAELVTKRFFEASIITLNGNKKTVRIHNDLIKNSTEETIGTIIMLWDITEYKKESLKLQQKERLIALGKMASGIVHEIKNPLTAIKGFNQLIKYKEEDEKILEYVCAIDQETENLEHFISDFLKFAKPSTPVLDKVGINKFINSLKLIIDTNTFLSGIKVSYELMSRDKFVMADVSQLRQVVLNIVKNALEAIEDGGGTELKIITQYHKQDKEISLKIFNDGKAIAEEDKMMIGTPFFTTKKNGTGLGLSISFQLIKEHGGRIEIESEEGVGTGFIIYLPSVT